MERSLVLANAIQLISMMDMAGVKGHQAPAVAKTIEGLGQMLSEENAKAAPSETALPEA